ncbi:MAG: 4-(cytidine 5'-diphospho)-2-C-methyl-D-erythritol kinase [Gemmatimonadota bacterium]|jgi:4-diphosphocytidyl-2-C-methyl-D-erythritol kinase
MSSEIWQAPAKINLYLKITGCRDDGYHTVDTGYQSIDLADTVTLAPAPPGSDVTCEVMGEWAEHVPQGDDNLAAHAARLIAEHTGRDPRVAITIDKRIPAGAGLGGGSSDAAAVLMALARRFAVPDPENTLIDVARELGADVHFFLQGGTRRGTGVGEHLEAIDPPAERWGILVYPGVRVSTGWAYDAYDTAGAGSSRNALESVVIEKYPVVGDALEVLRDGPAAIAQMSGSGSAVFALYEGAAQRDADVGRVNERVLKLADAHVWSFGCLGHGVKQLADSITPV